MYKKIKQLCKERGVSVTQMEKELQLSNGSVCKWGESIPRADSLQKVAIYLNVSTDSLLEEYKTVKTNLA